MRDIKSLVGVTRNKIGFDEEMEVDLWVQSPCAVNTPVMPKLRGPYC